MSNDIKKPDNKTIRIGDDGSVYLIKNGKLTKDGVLVTVLPEKYIPAKNKLIRGEKK